MIIPRKYISFHWGFRWSNVLSWTEYINKELACDSSGLLFWLAAAMPSQKISIIGCSTFWFSEVVHWVEHTPLKLVGGVRFLGGSCRRLAKQYLRPAPPRGRCQRIGARGDVHAPGWAPTDHSWHSKGNTKASVIQNEPDLYRSYASSDGCFYRFYALRSVLTVWQYDVMLWAQADGVLPPLMRFSCNAAAWTKSSLCWRMVTAQLRGKLQPSKLVRSKRNTLMNLIICLLR